VPDWARRAEEAKSVDPKTGEKWSGRPIITESDEPDCGLDQNKLDPKKCWLEDHSKWRVEHVQSGAVLALAPPIGVLILGVAFAWVVRGFRK
jgi:hypothetical protein